jgi:RNA polymerase sigma-B factor
MSKPNPFHGTARERLVTARLFRRYRATGSAEVREELVRRYLPLAHSLASRFARSSEPEEDLRQVASLALVKAIDGFQPERGTSFSSFAVPTILGHLKRHFRDATWSLHVPRRAQENALAVERAVEALTGVYGRTPTVAELADRLAISSEEVLDALLASSAYHTLSLDVPRNPHPDDDREEPLGETLGAEDERYELVEADATLAPLIRSLPKRERQMLQLRFVDGLTQAEIAKLMGVSQMHVSRLLRESIGRLRERAHDDEATRSQSRIQKG